MAQLNKGTTYSTVNSTVTIDNLNELVDNATLLPGAIVEQTALGGNATPASDQLLILSGSLLRRATVVQCLGGVTPTDLLNKNSNLSDLANITTAKTNLGLNNVENKSSATIRGELTSSNVTTALGYTPVNPTQVSSLLESVYPVGSIYTNASNSTNPGTLFGFGTWVAFGAGRVMVGRDPSDPLFDTAGETGGSKDAVVVSHTHTATSVVTDPGHTHSIRNDNNNQNGSIPNGGNGSNPSSTTVGNSTTGITVATTVASTGFSGTNANLQPYITVYMWQRTA
jgi:hypothetical protein